MRQDIDWQLATTRLQAARLLLRLQNREEEKNLVVAIAAMAVATPPGVSRVLQGAEATGALQRAQTALTVRALQFANRYSSHAWLFFLRCMPTEIFGNFQSNNSVEERRMVAEALSAMSTGSAAQSVPSQLPLPWIVRYVLCARAVAGAAVLKRIAAKGVPLRFAADSMPQIEESDPRWQAVQIHDSRHGSTSLLDWMSGTRAAVAGASSTNLMETIITLFARRVETLYEEMPEKLVSNGDELIDWSFQMGHGEALRLPEAMRDHHWYHPELPAALLISYAMFSLAVSDPEAETLVRRYGVLNVPESIVMELIDGLLQTDKSASLQAVLMGCELTTRSATQIIDVAAAAPLGIAQGMCPGLRRGPDGRIALDLYNHSYRVFRLLQPAYGSGNNIVKARSHDFELVVQASIDATAWAPPPELRQYRGRTLKRPDGSDLTDIDSLAYRNGIAILINAKSLAPPGAIDGDFRPTFNVRTALEEAVEDWRLKIQVLRDNLRGSNYDFSIVEQFVPLIVTAGPHFVYLDLLEPPIYGSLRPVASLGELEEFLKG